VNGEVATLDLGHAAVDEEFDAGDVAGVVGGEEGDGLGDLVGVAHAAEGDAGGHAGFELFGLLFAAGEVVDGGGFDVAGADGVDADFAVLEVGRPGTGEG